MSVFHNPVKSVGAILLAIVLAVAGIVSVRSQAQGDLALSISRDFGYSSGTGRIQGRFTLKVLGPDDLVRVVFLIDGQAMGVDKSAPYEIQFHTGDYSQNIHTLIAAGFTQDGRELHSNEYRLEFVAAEEGMQAAMKIALPILGVALAAMLLGIVLPAITGRKPRPSPPIGAPRSYGMLGGAICPKCSRPFSVHIWGINLLVGKLDRCPHCGGWSVVRRASHQSLKAAEAAEVEFFGGNAGLSPQSPEEKLQKALEESRYSDL